MRRVLLVLLCLFIPSALAADVVQTHGIEAPKRVALVVGNGRYQQIKEQLKNPANDAKAIAANLRSLGVEVIEAIDLDYRGMRDALRTFDRALQNADAGLFYYAGHGMEYRGRNYLFPTDAVLETEGDVGLGLIDIGQVLQVMETSVPTRLVFLDACRNNPLARGFRSALGASRSTMVGRGLGRIDAAVGTFIAYATSPGEIAADGDGVNSPFTTAMLQHLNEPGLEISQLMHRVRNSVIEATDEKQIPWESSSLRGPFVLNLEVTVVSPPVAANPAPVATQSTAGNERQRTEIVFWESIKDSDRRSAYEAYLERFGDDGVFAPLAKDRIDVLRQQQPRTLEASLNFDRRRVQETLSHLGYNAGVPDGIFGPQTRRAIKAWQESNNELATAYLSSRQVSAILAKAVERPVAAATRPITTTKPETAWPEPSTKLERKTPDKAEDGLTRAAKLHQRACDRGDAEGCGNLGYLYSEGFGVEQDYDKAKELYRRACNAGYNRSCGNLGYLHDWGLGVKQDYARARALYQQACDGDHSRSCHNLASLYEKGFGVLRDRAKARKLYQRACDNGHTRSCSMLEASAQKASTEPVTR